MYSKTEQLRTSLLGSTDKESVCIVEIPAVDCRFTTFRPVTEAEVDELLRKSPSKTRSRYPVPTKPVKE